MPGFDPHDTLLTLAIAIFAGILVSCIAHRVKVSAIVLLLGAGIGLGPQGLDLVHPDSLGESLGVIVSLAVGLILFEGGLTLDLKGYRETPGVIGRLLTIGVLTTWLGTAAVILLVFDLSVEIAILAASLVIVTGPTVIAPLLKRIHVNPKLHSILHWEGVLIDPIGVFIALLVFKFVDAEASLDAGHATALDAFGAFGVRVFAGLGIGLVGGFVIERLVRWGLPPKDMVNSFVLGCAMVVFGAAEAVMHETGLLAVTVAGFVLAVQGGRAVKQVKEFKQEIVELMIGLLFILLAARLDLTRFSTYGTELILAVALVMIVVRPLNVLLSSWRIREFKLDLNWREMAFLSWVAPRGIVSASMASLITLRLLTKENADPDAAFVEVFTYSVIIGTVVVQGFTAGIVARLVGVKAPERRGWLIVGAHRLGRRLAAYIHNTAGVDVVLVDANKRSVEICRKRGLTAFCADARDTRLAGRDAMLSIGNVLALTDNGDLNVLVCQSWAEEFGDEHLFRWGASDQRQELEPHSGTRVWSELPRPSRLSGELARSEAMLIVQGTDDAFEGSEQIVPLLSTSGNSLRMNGDAGFEPKEDEPILELHRETDNLSQSVDSRLVFTIEATEGDAVLRAVAAQLAEVLRFVDPETLLEELGDPDKLRAASIGFGVAIPRAQIEGLTEPVCAICRIPRGVRFEPGGPAIYLVFALLTEAEDTETYLDLLAEISQIVAHKRTRNRLLHTAHPDEVIDMVRSFKEGPLGPGLQTILSR